MAGLDTAPLAAAQAHLVGALVAGAPNPAGFDAARLTIEAEMLLAKRLRVAARAWPRLDLEGTRRERFVRWARANPPPEDGCGATDGRRFAAAMAAAPA